MCFFPTENHFLNIKQVFINFFVVLRKRKEKKKEKDSLIFTIRKKLVKQVVEIKASQVILSLLFEESTSVWTRLLEWSYKEGKVMHYLEQLRT